MGSIKLHNLMVDVVVKNGTVDCSESSHVASYREGIVFADTEGCQIKAEIHSQKVTVVAGTGRKGNFNGKAENASFLQTRGICLECDKDIFVTDAQTKLLTTIEELLSS